MTKRHKCFALIACSGLLAAAILSFLVGLLRNGASPSIGFPGTIASSHAEEAGADGATHVRAPVVAGAFYPREPEALKSMVDALLKKVQPGPLPGKTLALMAPHAGYVFSGETAAYGYKSLKGDWKTFVLIGAGHRHRLIGAALYHRGAFRTPLGTVPINEALCKKLLNECPFILDLPRAHAGEHSLEVQIPFLQRITKDFSIVPMVTNAAEPEVCEKMGKAIARVIKDENALIVISSDLSHFPEMKVADVVDQTTLRSLEFMDPGFFKMTCDLIAKKRIKELGCTYCGDTALLTGMHAALALGADRAVNIHYTNSGRVPRRGDPSRVVGYAAAAFVKTGKGGLPSKHKLGEADKKKLLQLVRDTIRKKVEKEPIERLPLSESTELNLPAAVFVTLHKDHRLRGCIGCTSPHLPLAEAVQHYAQLAAFRDHRFPAVGKDELDKLDVEVSILSPLHRIGSGDAIVPKKHGVVVRRGRRSGLFLPQVWDSLPEKERFMGELCAQKAHLPRDAWKDPETELYIFTVEAF